MSKPGKAGLERIIDAWGYSLQGFKATWKHEAAFRQETWAALVLTPCAFMLGDNTTQIALLLITLYGILMAELINSALESVVDRISDEQHELSGRAKDQGSAIVFLAIAIAASTWLLIAWQQF